MALQLRSHEQIREELTNRASVASYRTGLRLAEKPGRRTKALHVTRLASRLVVAAAGRKILLGREGRIIEAIAGLDEQPRTVSELSSAGKTIRRIGARLQIAVQGLDPTQLTGLTPTQQIEIHKQLSNVATYIKERGNCLAMHNTWHPPN
ncbi:MAG: hypothetical protein V1644_02075 [Candidatus Micrarchaeota archaeon]